jgi:RNA polymerase sigma-70 factor, ECF subfamily
MVVTSRLCLDQIRSARWRRERVHDSGDVDAAGRLAGTASVDPADRVTLDDSVHLALLVVLQRLSPAERVVFVMHDLFQMPFDTIAQTVGRSAPTCRKLAARARQKIAAPDGGARFQVSTAEHRRVTDKFIAACANGDLDALMNVLDPHVWGDVDLGTGAAQPPTTNVGSATVAGNLLRFWGAATLVSHPVNGQPAVLAFVNRRLEAVLELTLRGDLISSVHVIGERRVHAYRCRWCAVGWRRSSTFSVPHCH